MLRHEPPGDGQPAMLSSREIHTANPVIPRDGKHDKRSRTWFDALCRHKVDGIRRWACALGIDDEFPTPIGLPFFLKIGDDGDSTPQ